MGSSPAGATFDGVSAICTPKSSIQAFEAVLVAVDASSGEVHVARRRPAIREVVGYEQMRLGPLLEQHGLQSRGGYLRRRVCHLHTEVLDPGLRVVEVTPADRVVERIDV